MSARRTATAVAALGLAVATAAAPRPSAVAATTTASSSRMECTTSATNTFTLTAKPGAISTPDGNTVRMWGYAAGSGAYQYPGPVLCVHAGDAVTVVLKNSLPVDTSLVFPGQQGVQVDGSPSAPQADSAGNLTALAQGPAASGGSATYTFSAAEAGTYIYESGTDQVRQLDMGLFGVLVVRPRGTDASGLATDGRRYAYSDAAGYAAESSYGDEFLMLLSEIDPDLHAAVAAGRSFDLSRYNADYFMVNGRSFPDTLAPNHTGTLPSQPYSSLMHIQAKSAGYDQPALARYANVSRVGHPFHPHANHGQIIARDGRLLRTAQDDATDTQRFTVVVGAGQTADGRYDWSLVDYCPNGPNPGPGTAVGACTKVPVTLPANQDLLFKDAATYYSGSPYLGVKDSLPVGTTSYNQCGEYYHVWHSHALNEVTNYGAAMGGMLTLERIDPVGGCP